MTKDFQENTLAWGQRITGFSGVQSCGDEADDPSLCPACRVGSGSGQEPFVQLEPRFRSLLSRDAVGALGGGCEVNFESFEFVIEKEGGEILPSTKDGVIFDLI